MNKASLILFVSMLINISVWAQETLQTHSLSLAEAVSYGLLNNETLLNASLEMDKSVFKVKEKTADGLPQINGSLTTDYNPKIPSLVLDFGDGPQTIQMGTDFSGGASINFSQMIFDGSFFVGLEASKTYQELSTKDHIKTKIDVVEAVTKAYYGVLVNELSLELVVKNFGRLDTLLRETQIMHKNGFVEKIDVNRVKIQHNNVSVERQNTEKLLAISRAILKFQMGMPVQDNIVLTDKLTTDLFEEEDSVNKDFNYTDRIEYSIWETNHSLAKLDIRHTKFQYAPRLDLVAGIGANMYAFKTSEVFNFSNQNWPRYSRVGISLHVPIFDGTRKRFMNQQKRVTLNQLENSKKQLLNNLSLQVKEASIKFENSVNYMNVQIENMELSEEVFSVTKKKYKQGVGSNIDVLNADADYKRAQTSFFTSLYDALIAKVNYKKALGKLL